MRYGITYLNGVSTYCWFAVALLLKNPFGLAYTIRDQPVTLPYLFWKPPNAKALSRNIVPGFRPRGIDKRGRI